MATREDAEAALIDAIKTLADATPEAFRGGSDYLRAHGEAAKALAETWQIIKTRQGRASAVG